MGLKLYSEEDIQEIANAIRLKRGSTSAYSISEMASQLSDLHGTDYIYSYFTKTLQTLNFSDISYIKHYFFFNQTSLLKLSAPNCLSIGSSAFYSCTALSEIYSPSVSSIGSYAFYSCSNLVSANFPLCTSIG